MHSVIDAPALAIADALDKAGNEHKLLLIGVHLDWVGKLLYQLEPVKLHARPVQMHYVLNRLLYLM